MPLPEKYGLPQPEIEWDENGQPLSKQFRDIYYQSSDGLAETRHVFLQGNRLPDRWPEFFEAGLPGKFTIGELGFGTGLNFLATWQIWREFLKASGDNEKWQLHFVSTELHPLPREILEKVYAHWSELSEFSDQLIDRLPFRTQGRFTLQFPDDHLTLTLLHGDANESLRDLPSVDAWYLDGFSPAENPELWNQELADLVKSSSRPGSTLATYTAAGWVRRLFESADGKPGFRVQKSKGFGRKKDMTVGEMPGIQKTSVVFSLEHKTECRESVAIIGGGIAGCTTAHMMAQNGKRITVFEASGELAYDASGNKAAVVMPQISKIPTERSLFSISAFHFASNFYSQLSKKYDLNWEPCGVVRMAEHKQLKGVIEVFDQLDIPSELAKLVGPENIEQILGMHASGDGLFFPLGGFLSPSLFCEAMVSDSDIQVRLNTPVAAINQRPDGCWSVVRESGETESFDSVIIANSHSGKQFDKFDWLPTHKVRGQVVHLPANEKSSAQKTVFCQSGYMSPEKDGEHLIGASWDREVKDRDLRIEVQNDLLKKVKAWNPSIGFDEEKLYPGRASFRCTVPDRTPIVGALSDHDGLYLNLGHGSHGVTNAPICAAWLAGFHPFETGIQKVLNPARFVDR